MEAVPLLIRMKELVNDRVHATASGLIPKI